MITSCMCVRSVFRTNIGKLKVKEVRTNRRVKPEAASHDHNQLHKTKKKNCQVMATTPNIMNAAEVSGEEKLWMYTFRED